jgi:hypothetical protein
VLAHIFRSRERRETQCLLFSNLSVRVKTSNRGQAIVTSPQHSATINAILSPTAPHIALSLHPHQQRLLNLHTNTDRKHTSQQKRILPAPYKQEPKRFTTMPVLSTVAKIFVVMFAVIALHATRYSSSEMDNMNSDIEYESIQVSTDILLSRSCHP